MRTAAELRITQGELDALVWVAEGLESGRLRHVSPENEDPENPGFNMVDFNVDDSYCGSPKCVGGWVYLRLNGGEHRVSGDHNYARSASPILHDLYFPGIEDRYEDVSAEWAARTIRLFLRTGSVDWERVREVSR